MRPALSEHPKAHNSLGRLPCASRLRAVPCAQMGLARHSLAGHPALRRMPARPAPQPLLWPHSPEQFPAASPEFPALRFPSSALPPGQLGLLPEAAADTHPEPPPRTGFWSAGGAAQKSAQKSENERSSGSSGQPVECQSSPTQGIHEISQPAGNPGTGGSTGFRYP